ncbi:MAG TPA: 4Fe-4S dicluster domain-containing protein [Bacteroidota bacterium]|nr:4Fe-4S dicluster domain-containing protein [Bacteroidota bacterium]
MNQLNQIAKELLTSQKVKLVIGYGEGTDGRVRPVFVRKSEDASQLIWDDRCRQNLAVYLNKTEIREIGFPIAIVSLPATVRSIVQLIAEHQFQVEDVIPIVQEGANVTTIENKERLEQYAAANPVVFPPFVVEEIENIRNKSVEERFEYWQEELSRCFKCYACRAACPLCYCERCITDVNTPQWVCVPPHAIGTFEWHMNRAMHLAGRCVECGSCTIACPVGIPIGLLTMEATRIAREELGYEPGIKCDVPAALATFRPDDKESFIL